MVRRPGDPEGFARDNGGVPAGTGGVRLVLRSTTDEPVVVSDLRPVEDRRRGVVEGGYAAKVAYGCGVMPVRHVSADLALTVSRSEPETVQVQAGSRTAAVDWKIRILYTAPGADEVTSLVVGEPAGPFTVTAVPEGTPVWTFLPGQGMVEDESGDPYGYC